MRNIPEILPLRANTWPANETRLLHRWMEISTDGLKILHNSRIKILTNRGRDMRTLLGHVKIQILPHRPPRPTRRRGPPAAPRSTKRKEGHERDGQPETHRICKKTRHVPTLQAQPHPRSQERGSRRSIKKPQGKPERPERRGRQEQEQRRHP